MQRSSVRKNQIASTNTRLYYLDDARQADKSQAAAPSRGNKTRKNAKAKNTDNALKGRKNNYDVTLIAVIFILVFFGLIMVFSASAPSALAYEGNEYHFILRQGIFAIIGFVAMFVCARIDYHFYGKWALPILVGSFVILFLVYIPGLGMVINDARRWIGIGSLSLQPSEITKIGVIIFFAYSLSKVKEKIKKFWSGIVIYLAIMGAFAAVILEQPHFSCAVVLCLSCMVILYVAGAKKWHFAILAVFAALVGVFMILKAPYRLERVLTFLDPFADTADSGYQITNSLYAIGSGGLFGLGLGMSRQKLLYLPEPHNDFIFAIVCEELGFLGALVVVVLFGMLIWRGYRIAQTARDTYGSYLATGITSLIGIQTALNIAVVTSSVPVTGVALPFFSYGGTSLVIMLASMGILLNISKQCRGLSKNKQ